MLTNTVTKLELLLYNNTSVTFVIKNIFYNFRKCMIKLFQKYLTVGIMNTAIHWSIFTGCILILQMSQKAANLIAFCIAVTFSFIVNSKWTFKSKVGLLRYIIFTTFMGGLAFTTGFIAEQMSLPAIITLSSFSALSLLIGFIYSRYIVFRS